MGKVDQHIKLLDHRLQITREGQAQATDACQLTHISAHQGAVRAIDRRAQARIRGLLHRFDQGFAHAPSGAHHCNTLHNSQLQAQGLTPHATSDRS